jgi:hypothetical protein
VGGAAVDQSTGRCECKPGLTYLMVIDACGVCSDNCGVCDMTGDCEECKNGFYETDDTPVACEPCHTNCSLCDDGTNTKCSECSEGNYQLPNTTICEGYCPTLTTKNDSTK